MKKISHMPYNKTVLRELQLEWEQCERELINGQRKALIKFSGLMIVLLTFILGSIYLITFISSMVPSIIGVR